ncbi:MAG: DNA repair protein RadA [Desulfonatronovibrionaceae bacterium]
MKQKKIYRCAECAHEVLQWQGQCPGCGEWNTLREITLPAKNGSRRKERASESAKPCRLDSLDNLRASSFSCGWPEIDSALGGGMPLGGVILLAGEPGIGKSTLLLQLVARVAEQGKKSVYVSAEETLEQLQSRAQRLGLLEAGVEALAAKLLEEITPVFTTAEPPSLLILDSVQTVGSSESDSVAGTPSQVRNIASEMISLGKGYGCTVIIVGHVTKEGQIAGPKLLEHMVDTVLHLEGDREHLFRVLRVVKNRYGPDDEIVLFQMTGSGLEGVKDPSTFFLEARDPSLSGTAVVMGLDGQKPFALEVQALAGQSFLAMPRRTALGFDANRLHLLLAVLEKKLGINLGQADIYAKIGGGLRITDPGLDLGMAAAVLSSFFDRPLPEGAVFWGEIDLNGQVRPVLGHDLRLKQAGRLGYSPIFCSGTNDGEGFYGVQNVMRLQEALFG